MSDQGNSDYSENQPLSYRRKHFFTTTTTMCSLSSTLVFKMVSAQLVTSSPIGFFKASSSRNRLEISAGDRGFRLRIVEAFAARMARCRTTGAPYLQYGYGPIFFFFK